MYHLMCDSRQPTSTTDHHLMKQRCNGNRVQPRNQRGQNWKLLGYLYRKRKLSRFPSGLRVKKGHRVLGEEKPFLRENKEWQGSNQSQPPHFHPFIDTNTHIRTTHIVRTTTMALNVQIILTFYNTWHVWDFHKTWRILCFLETAEHYTMIHGNWLLLVLGCSIKKQI